MDLFIFEMERRWIFWVDWLIIIDSALFWKGLWLGENGLKFTKLFRMALDRYSKLNQNDELLGGTGDLVGKFQKAILGLCGSFRLTG